MGRGSPLSVTPLLTSGETHLLLLVDQKRQELHWKYLWTKNERVHLQKNEKDI